MNDFFDNLGKAAKDAVKKAAKTSDVVVEFTKTSVNMKFDEAKRENFYKEIGKIIYNIYKADSEQVPSDTADFCRCIDEIEKSLVDSKSKLAKLKNRKYCTACGIKLNMQVKYCPTCGEKQPEIQFEEETDGFEYCDCCNEDEEEGGECCSGSADSCCSEESCDCSSDSADSCCNDATCNNADCDCDIANPSADCCNGESCDCSDEKKGEDNI